MQSGLIEDIRLGSTDLPEAGMQPGDYLVLSVKDTGCGMDEEVRKRKFEPFFTTKPVGEGTGLRLSVVFGIVKNHKGSITVYSEPGKGSIFKVYLPKINTGVSLEAETLQPIPRGNERILFVDDEEIIVNSVRNMLQHLGYKVTTQMDSQEALKLFSEKPSEFDLVITDQTMPFMTGETLGKEMMRIRPDIPVILCTGYSDMISSEKAAALGFRGSIMKPFTVREGAERCEVCWIRHNPNSQVFGKRDAGILIFEPQVWFHYVLYLLCFRVIEKVSIWFPFIESGYVISNKRHSAAKLQNDA